MVTRNPGPLQGDPLLEGWWGGTMSKTEAQPTKPAGSWPRVPPHRCAPDKTMVVVIPRGLSDGTAPEPPVDRLASMLGRLDAWLTGTASQSRGRLLWGEGDGQGSTASRPAAGFKDLGPPIDLAELFEFVDIISLGTPGGAHRTRLQDLRKAYKNRDAQAFAENVHELFESIDEIRAEYEAAARANLTPEPTPTPTPPPNKTPAKAPGADAGSKKPDPAPTGRVKDRFLIFPSGWVSAKRVGGNLHGADGGEYIYTDKTGARSRIREWCDKSGNSTYQLIERMAK